MLEEADKKDSKSQVYPNNLSSLLIDFYPSDKNTHWIPELTLGFDRTEALSSWISSVAYETESAISSRLSDCRKPARICVEKGPISGITWNGLLQK